MIAELRSGIQQMEQELAQLESQVQRAQLTATMNPQQQLQLRQLMEQERAVRAEKKAQIEKEIERVQALPLGSEIIQGTVEALATVNVGDDLNAVLNAEILIEDGKVIAIRKGEA